MDMGQAGRGSSPAPSGMGGSPSVRRGRGGGVGQCPVYSGRVPLMMPVLVVVCVCVDWRRL